MTLAQFSLHLERQTAYELGKKTLVVVWWNCFAGCRKVKFPTISAEKEFAAWSWSNDALVGGFMSWLYTVLFIFIFISNLSIGFNCCNWVPSSPLNKSSSSLSFLSSGLLVILVLNDCISSSSALSTVLSTFLFLYFGCPVVMFSYSFLWVPHAVPLNLSQKRGYLSHLTELNIWCGFPSQHHPGLLNHHFYDLEIQSLHIYLIYSCVAGKNIYGSSHLRYLNSSELCCLASLTSWLTFPPTLWPLILVLSRL